MEKVEKNRFIQGPLGWWWGSLAELAGVVNSVFAAYEPRTPREIWGAYLALSKDMDTTADPFLAYWNGKAGMIQGCDPWCRCARCAAAPENVGGDNPLVPGGWVNDVLRFSRQGVWSVGIRTSIATSTSDVAYRVGHYIDGHKEDLDIPGQIL